MEIREIIGNTTATPAPQTDWAQTDATKADYIKNKPEILTEDQVKDLIDEFGGDAQVQADWAQADNTKTDYIKNKPTLGTIAAKDEVAKSDLAADVQASLGKADTAIQSIAGLATEDYVDGKIDSLGNMAAKDTVEKTDLSASVQASLDKADSALQSYEETDPTVPAWAKAASKPSYTASEVGAPTVAEMNAAIAAIPTPDVSGQINTHNTATTAHNDIRLLISGLTERLNALANSDDATLDQMSEVVAYIKANRDLISQITTNKVNVSDIVNDLVTNVSNKPLSAAQGVALKALIDAIDVPTKVSELTNDSGYLTSYTESDPTVPAWAKAANKPSYAYSEITDRPTLGTMAAKNAVEKTDLASDVQASLNKADSAIQSIDGLATEQYVDNKVAGLTPDWNAPEGELGHILNRTHWKDEDITVTEILHETVLSAFDMGDGTMVYGVESGVDIQANKNYTINYRGVEYNCTAVKVQGIESELYLGNIYAIGAPGSTPSNEPFVIVAVPEDGAIIIVDIDGNTDDLTISIAYVEDNSVYHKLDAKYIPDEVMDRLPEWIEGGEGEEILPETQLEGADGEFLIVDTFDLKADEKYIVTYNGVEYETKAIEFIFEGIPGIILGDVYLMTEGMIGDASTGEPFGIMYAPAVFGSMGFTAGVYALDGAETVTIGIRDVGGKKEIDPSQIKDMYYEESGAGKVIIPEEEIAINPDSSMFESSIDALPTFEVGKNYIINYNHVPYTCVCQDALNIFGYSGYIFGDTFTASGGQAGGAATGEPFCLVFISVDGENVFTLFALDGSESVVLSIEQAAYSDIHKIDNKYLDLDWIPKAEYGPGDLVYSATCEVNLNSEGNALQDNLSNLSSIYGLANGQKVFVKINNNSYEASVTQMEGAVIIGSLSAIQSNTFLKDAPFLFYAMAQTYGMLVIDPSVFSEGECVFEVYTSVNANALPEEFLPTSFQGNTYFLDINPDELVGQTITQEIKETIKKADLAFQAGKAVFMGSSLIPVIDIYADYVDNNNFQLLYAKIGNGLCNLCAGSTTSSKWVLDEITFDNNTSFNPDTLATVATTGSYNDLIDKPELFSGSYNDLVDKPEIPSLDGYYTKNEVDELIPSAIENAINGEYSIALLYDPITHPVTGEAVYYAVRGVGEHIGTDIRIPKVYNGLPVIQINPRAFADTQITSVIIPDSIKFIGNHVFYGCSNLTSVIIPDSVTSISDYMFYNCTELTSIVIPDSVTSIGSYAFCNTGLTSITIPDSVTDIDSGAFNGCSGLTSVILGNSVTSIGNYALMDCKSLTSVVLGNNVQTIGEYAFYACTGLTNIIIPHSVINIEENAFFGCNLTSLIIPDSVTTIGKTIINKFATHVYCEADAQPSGWATDWNASGSPVTWDFANDFVSVNERIDAVASGGGSPGESVTNVSWNDLTDKPFYSEVAEVLPELTLEVEDDLAAISDPIDLIVGNTYTVTMNGVEYTLVAKSMPLDDEISLIYLGNAMVFDGPDTGEAFCIISSPDLMAMGEPGTQILIEDASITSITLKIVGEVIQSIDKKYLPDSHRFGTETIIDIPETLLTFVDGADIGMENMYISIASATASPTSNDSCTVRFNGETYSLKPTIISIDGLSACIIGNAAIFNSVMGTTFEDTGEPFMFLRDGDTWMILSIIGGDISVCLSHTAVKKIEPQYLQQVVIPASSTNGTEFASFAQYVADITTDDFFEILESGGSVWVDYRTSGSQQRNRSQVLLWYAVSNSSLMMCIQDTDTSTKPSKVLAYGNVDLSEWM